MHTIHLSINGNEVAHVKGELGHVKNDPPLGLGRNQGWLKFIPSGFRC